MPWRADVLMTEGAQSGCTLTLSLISDQGWYLYQGASTRRKWLSLLSSIQDDEVVIALQAHPVRST